MEAATTEEQFHHAVQLIQNLPKSGNFQPSNDLKLKFYSLFKQATVGQCDIARPGFWDVISRAKWDAWASLGGMSKEEAMKRYVKEFVEILKTQPFDDKAHEYVSLMGPFIEFAPKEFQEKYEIKNKKGAKKGQPNPDLIIGQAGGNSCKERATKPIKKNNEVWLNDNPSGDEEKLINGHNLNGTKQDSDCDEYSDVFDQANEEFAEDDSMEHCALHEEKQVKISEARGGGEKRFGKTNDSHSSPILGSSGGSRGNHGNPHRTRGGRGNMPSHHYPAGAFAGGAGGGRRGDESESPLDPIYSDVSEELAFAVIRLQHTMEEVVKRLDSLESLLQEKKSSNFMKGMSVTENESCFSNLFGIPLRTALLIFGWPFLAHWIIILLIQRRRRR